MPDRTGRVCVMALAVMFLVPGTVRASDRYRVANAEIVVVLPMTIGGSFEARTEDVSGEITPSANQADQGGMTGAIQVKLATLETGIELRDTHLREKYLEVQKGPEFAVAQLEQLRIERLEGKTTFKGILLLHGERREISGTADLRQLDGGIRVRAQFALRVSNFKIAKASYLGVGVRDEIQIKVNMTVVPGQTAAVQ